MLPPRNEELPFREGVLLLPRERELLPSKETLLVRLTLVPGRMALPEFCRFELEPTRKVEEPALPDEKEPRPTEELDPR